MRIYEQALDEDWKHAMSEGSRYFEERSAVQDALRKVTGRLRDLGIPYAVAGGMALFAHGFRRFTEDVDILVGGEDLRTIHRALEGLGYIHPFQGSKNLRDAESGVRIEFLVAGQFPGDGKPKPVAFPSPAAVTVEREGVHYLNLPTLIELKLASGMTNSERVKDLADVQELIKLMILPEKFTDYLAPYVHGKYRELWVAVHHQSKRYLLIWRNQIITTEAKSIKEMAAALRQAADTLQAMLADGVTMVSDGGTADDHTYLMTTDPSVAQKYDMHEASEFWDGGDDHAIAP